MKKMLLTAALLLTPLVQADDGLTLGGQIERAMWGDHRSEENTARNRYRHPVGTLEFFGLEPGMTVMEIWPGGGWYSEVLAPVLREQGQFVVATWDPAVEGQPAYRYELPKEMQAAFEARPDIYDRVRTAYFSPPESASLGEAGSLDMILTFRNTHGWINAGQAPAIFAEFARVLKPGGVLGVVQHRAADGSDPAVTAKQGYVSEQAVIELATSAGLVLEARSEVNANPRDSKDYAKGVWTLPPSLTLGEEDRDRYLAIGESDRMTLRFRKPAE